MGQWEKRMGEVRWDEGRESFPIELANRGVKEGKVKGVIEGVFKFFRAKRRKRVRRIKVKGYGGVVEGVKRGPPYGVFLERKGIRRADFLKAIGLGFLSVFIGCKDSSVNPVEVGGRVKVIVSDTFSGESLSGIPVVVDGSFGRLEGVTEGGEFSFDIEGPERLRIRVNFSNSKGAYNGLYIPSEYVFGVTGDYIAYYDIVKERDLNPYGYDWKQLLKAYRGLRVNQVWVKQPEKWVVYDPHGYLKKYEDKRRNPIFDNIMAGFRAIEEYTNGFIRAPSRDDVIIRFEDSNVEENVIYFDITDGRAFETEQVNSNNEIIRSGAGTPGETRTGTIMELVSSVQGGDNDSYYGVFNTGYVDELDRKWGDFNYNKRSPGDSFKLNYEGYRVVETRVKLKF